MLDKENWLLIYNVEILSQQIYSKAILETVEKLLF